jgi:hypothetical protein
MSETEGKPAKKIHMARIDLPPHEYARLKSAADRYCLAPTAYARMAVMERIEHDEAKLTASVLGRA